jgi:FAD/FMN-containing dehydrogenase
MRRWRDYTRSAPDEVSSTFILASLPAIPEFPVELHNRPVVIADAMHAGSGASAEEALRPLRKLAQPLTDQTGPAPYLRVQSTFDPLVPTGDRYYWKSLNLHDLSDEIVDLTIEYSKSRPSQRSAIVVRHLGGAMGRVGADATAYGDRSALYNLSIDSMWSSPEDDQRNISWSRATWDDLRRFSSGVYLNFPGFQEEGGSLVKAQFGENYQRLLEVKRRYDPNNLFRLNQNINPKE